MKRELPFDSVQRQNRFLIKKKKLDEKNKKWKSKIIDKHMDIIQKVNEINLKKDKAIKIAKQLEMINKQGSDYSPNKDLVYSFNSLS